MSAIGPGDWVECICGGQFLELGALYCIAWLEDDAGPCESCGGVEPGAVLVGFESLSVAACTACELRPIYRPKSDLIEQLKQPAPSEREPEHA